MYRDTRLWVKNEKKRKGSRSKRLLKNPCKKKVIRQHRCVCTIPYLSHFIYYLFYLYLTIIFHLYRQRISKNKSKHFRLFSISFNTYPKSKEINFKKKTRSSANLNKIWPFVLLNRHYTHTHTQNSWFYF